MGKKGPSDLERAAVRLSYHSGRLLELFQWDEADIDKGKLNARIAELKADLVELEEEAKADGK